MQKVQCISFAVVIEVQKFTRSRLMAYLFWLHLFTSFNDEVDN